MAQFRCCICGKKFDGLGNNPIGAVIYKKGKKVFPKFKAGDRCCDICNLQYVISGRLMYLKKD